MATKDTEIQAEYRAQMNRLAALLDAHLNAGLPGRTNGFVLLMFPFGDGMGERCNYISNAQRKEVVVLLKEMVARFEGQPEISGRA